MVLYKYCSVKSAIEIIKSGKLNLQVPRSFNDPYDCLHTKFKIKFGYEKIKFLLDKIPEKFKPSDNEIIKAIQQHNDVFDLSYFYSISCFSETNANILMWSHYARNHSGVCLGFEFSEKNSENLKRIRYVDQCFDSRKTQPSDAILIKYEDWKYEKEWRYIKYNERSAIRYILAGVNNLVKNRLDVQNQLEWENEKKIIWKDYLVEESNTLEVKPSSIFLGCEYTNHLRMNENVVIDKTTPVRDEAGNVVNGIGKVTQYLHVDLLKEALAANVPVSQFRMDATKFKLEAQLLTNDDINNIIANIESVRFATYENIDVLKLQ